MYHMRFFWDLIDQDLLATFDGRLRASVSASLCGDSPGHSWRQATMEVTCGGLGLRTALGAALPAFVASGIMCRPLVSTMVDHYSAAFGTPCQPIMVECDECTDEALSRLVSTLPSPAASWLLSLTKPWLNVSSSGATSSLGPRTPAPPAHSLLVARPRHHPRRW